MMNKTNRQGYALDTQGRLNVRVDGIVGLHTQRDLAKRHGVSLSSAQYLMRSLTINEPDLCQRFEVNLTQLHDLWASDARRNDINMSWHDALLKAVNTALIEPTTIIETSIEKLFEITRISEIHSMPGEDSPSSVLNFEIAGQSHSPCVG